ncbi:MAG: hypothetical protein GXX96_34955 [Planctomycetaceae bacterium]|nr:hypothetical protein [Planctomycetaceae bacterium]
MAEDVLLAPAKSRQPVATETTRLVYPEWTDFGQEPEDSPSGRRARKSQPDGIRARKETKLTIDGQWHEHTLQLATDQQICALRFDPCN